MSETSPKDLKKSAFVSDNGDSVCLSKNNTNKLIKCNFLVV